MVIASKVTVLVLTIVQNFLSVTPKDIDLQEQCEHKHTSFCQQCNDIAVCRDKIKQGSKMKVPNFTMKSNEKMCSMISSGLQRLSIIGERIL